MNKLLRLSGWVWGLAVTVGCGPAEGPGRVDPSAPAALATQTRAMTSSQWSSSASMSIARGRNSVVKLDSGLVLVAGGFYVSVRGVTTVLPTAELYNPYANAWQGTGSLSTARYCAAMVKLPSGKILISGGRGPTWASSAVLNSTELYDPSTGTWSPAAPMLTPRERHTATLLDSGKVLVTGGTSTGTAELYDPATNTWSPAGDVAHDTQLSVPVRLYSGDVLLVNASTRQVDLYNPGTNTWRQVASIPTDRNKGSDNSTFTATRLYSGAVLVVGGTAVDLYDPYNDRWSAAAPLLGAYWAHTATLLYSGQLLIAGGSTNTAQLYDPSSNTWSDPPVDMSPDGVFLATSVLLDSGKVLLSGRAVYPTSTATIFTP